MAKVNIMIPSGLPAEKKRQLIQGVKDIFCEAFGYTQKGSSVMIEEFGPDNLCDNAKRRVTLLVFYTVGRTDAMKHKCAGLFHRFCQDFFGSDIETSIIFKEHHNDNVVAHGGLKTYSPDYVDQYSV